MPYSRKVGRKSSYTRRVGAKTRTKKTNTMLPTTETLKQKQHETFGPWVFFNSSRVSRARYDSSQQLLEVDWVDGGVTYLYEYVPPNIWRNMQRVASLGKFVNRVLNQYPYAPRVD